MNRFVVLFHKPAESQPKGSMDESASDAHYDLMLEHDNVLATWRLNAWPPLSDERVVRLPDHRLAYLQYEGPISGNRGTVRRVDEGLHNGVAPTAANCRVYLQGALFQGVLTLVASGSTAGDNAHAHWSLLVDDLADA